MRRRDYHVVVEGELSPAMTEAFDGMQVAPVGGRTIIAGPVRDQAELHALLQRVGDFGLTLVSAAAVPDHGRAAAYGAGGPSDVPARPGEDGCPR